MEDLNLPVLMLKTNNQIKALKVDELRKACKVLGVSGYSKLKKDALVDLVISEINEQRNLLNQLPTVESASEVTHLPSKEPDKVIYIDNKPYEAFARPHLERILGDCTGMKLDEFELHIKKVCADTLIPLLVKYGARTLVGSVTAKMQGSKSFRLDHVHTTKGQIYDVKLHEDPEVSASRQRLFVAQWKETISSLRNSINSQSDQRVTSYTDKKVLKPEVDNVSLVNWGRENLTNPSFMVRGIALAILSGRRMVEIHGTSTYELVDGNFIRIHGLAKTKTVGATGVFVPLCEPELWLNSINGMTRGKSHETVNEVISRNYSRSYKKLFESWGLEKFKDTRDVYANTCYETIVSSNRFEKPETTLKALMCHFSGTATNFYVKLKACPMPELLHVFTAYEDLRTTKGVR